MTREEIKELKGLAASIGLYDDKYPCKRAVVLGKAIEALEQQPCTDAISRQAVLDLAKFDGRENLGSIIHAFDVEQLPPVTPAEKVGQWIPVSERLPEEDGKYYVTLENECVKILRYATVQTLRYPKGFYYVTDDGFAWRQTINPVIAWMPLPEPYRGRK